MVKAAIIGIFAIVVVSLIAVVSVNNISGAGTVNGYYGHSVYGASKVYGPGLKKLNLNPSFDPDRFYDVMKAQEFMYANKDKWICQYAESQGDDPCIFDYDKRTWCCIPTDVNFRD